MLGDAEVHLLLTERDVESTVDTEWVVDGGKKIIQPFYDRVLDVEAVAGADTLYAGTITKHDLAVVSGADIVDGATLCCASLRGSDPDRNAVQLFIGLYVPDTDVGDSFDVYVGRDGISIEAIPWEE